MFDKGVTGNNLMMTLYFSCLQECTELLVGIFSLAAFLKRLFQRWPWQTGSNAYIIFHCIFSIFLYLNRSSISVIVQIHTYSIQLICDNVLFTLLNITDHSVVIDKLQQDKSGQALWYLGSVSADSEAPDIMFFCSMVDYGIHTYIEAVRYIFISKICFCVLMVQIADSPLWS